MSRDFDGIGDFLGATSTAALNITGALTISAFVNLDVGSIYHEIVGKENAADPGGTNNPYTFRTTNDAVPKLLLLRASAGTYVSATSTNGFSTGAWHHVAVSDSTGLNGVTFYIDGLQDSTGDINLVPTTSTGNCRIGKRGDDALFLDGKVAFVTIHNVVLTAGEIRQLSQGRPIYRGLVGFWPLYGVGSPEPDYSGNVQSMTITGALQSNHAPIASPFGMDYGWRGAFTAAAAATGNPYYAYQQQ